MNQLKQLAVLTILSVLSFVLLTGCGNEKTDVLRLVAERDSILDVNVRQTEELNELNGYVGMIANSLDSITRKEGMLKMKSREGQWLNREELKQELADFSDLISRQRLHIASLEDSLKKKGGNAVNLQRIVKSLKQQLEEKDKTIEELRANLKQKNVDIGRLTTKISTLTGDVDRLRQMSDAQTNALKVQDEIINEGYVKIATKKELSAEGLLSGGGLFSNKKLHVDNLAKGKYSKVDMRQFTEVTIASQKVKILTSHPKSSYRIISNGNNTIMKIKDANSFWSVSNYLIIQTN